MSTAPVLPGGAVTSRMSSDIKHLAACERFRGLARHLPARTALARYHGRGALRTCGDGSLEKLGCGDLLHAGRDLRSAAPGSSGSPTWSKATCRRAALDPCHPQATRCRMRRACPPLTRSLRSSAHPCSKARLTLAARAHSGASLGYCMTVVPLATCRSRTASAPVDALHSYPANRAPWIGSPTCCVTPASAPRPALRVAFKAHS
jgi:hypothetical protein